MSKINVDEVLGVLKKNKVDQQTVTKVAKELEAIIQEEKQDRAANATPKAKNEFVIILSDPNGELAGKDFVGWVAQVKQGDDLGTVLTRVNEAAKAYNTTTKKGKKNPIKTIADAFVFVTRKFFKEKNIQVKTKDPVRVLITNNQI